jgi:hypothetical protein
MWFLLLIVVIAVIIGPSLWQRRKTEMFLRCTDLTAEQCAMVPHDLPDGKRAASEHLIASAQARTKAVRRAAGGDIDAMLPSIGHHIPWIDVIGQVFRVLDFDRAGTTIGTDGQVHAKSIVEPYGYLLIGSPILNQRAILPICHRDDFLLACSVFDEPKLAPAVENAELLVTYVPEHSLPDGRATGLWHAFHYVIVPPGTLQHYYEVDDSIHMAQPAPEKLFGPFTYSGEIRVQVNRHPQL